MKKFFELCCWDTWRRHCAAGGGWRSFTNNHEYDDAQFVFLGGYVPKEGQNHCIFHDTSLSLVVHHASWHTTNCHCHVEEEMFEKKLEMKRCTQQNLLSAMFNDSMYRSWLVHSQQNRARIPFRSSIEFRSSEEGRKKKGSSSRHVTFPPARWKQCRTRFFSH